MREKDELDHDIEPTPKQEIMKNIVITKSGETIEVINGVLSCKNTGKNWATIGDFCDAFEDLEMNVKIKSDVIMIDFPETIPTGMTLSLLQHFEYQDITVDSLVKPVLE